MNPSTTASRSSIERPKMGGKRTLSIPESGDRLTAGGDMHQLAPAPRIALALASGGAVAAFVWCLAFFVPAMRYEPSMLLAFVIAAVVWIAGSALIAGPIWLMLHRHSIRGPLAAVLLGLCLGFIVSLALDTNLYGLLASSQVGSSFGDGHGLRERDGILTRYGWQMALRSAAIIAICSALGGFVTWRFAYRGAGPSTD